MKSVKILALSFLITINLIAQEPTTSEHLQNILESEYKVLNQQQNQDAILFDKIQTERLEEDLEISRDRSDLPQSNINYTKIAILGNSKVKISPVGFNRRVLNQLLYLIKIENPQAVFFTGNLVYGLKPEEDSSQNVIQLQKTRNIFGRLVSSVRGTYDSTLFKQQLTTFTDLIKSTLGDIPFYPLPGEHESLGPDAQELFRKQFNIANNTPAGGPPFAYTVAIDKVNFTLLGTDYFDSKLNKPVEKAFSETTLPWLENLLAGSAKKYNYNIVLGNDPAYSTESVFGYPQGIDQNLKSARQFWKALSKNHVLAYICSNEVLYDRRFDKGVWQIISGGAGALASYSSAVETTFFHYLLLYFPKEGNGKVFVEVYDANGKLRDRFALSQQAPIIHDFRISNQ